MHILSKCIIILFVLLSGCASNDSIPKNEITPSDQSQSNPPSESETDSFNHHSPDTTQDSNMTEEAAVLAAFEKMQQAMIDKDIDTLKSLVTEDKTFTHMSGKVQTKEEFFDEITDGTLNYYKYEINNPVVTVNGDRAELTADTTLTAKVYGMSGTWTLSTHAYFIKVNNSWIQCNPF